MKMKLILETYTTCDANHQTVGLRNSNCALHIHTYDKYTQKAIAQIELETG